MAAGDVTVNIDSMGTIDPAGLWIPVAGTDYHSAGDNTNFSFITGSTNRAMTIAFWTLPKTANIAAYRSFVSKDDVGSQREWTIGTINSTQVGAYIFGALDGTIVLGRRGTTVGYAKNTWVHYAITYDGSTDSTGIKIYENGVQIDDANDNTGTYATAVNGTEVMRIGDRSGASTGISGAYSDFRFYHKELSAAEITDLYNGVFNDTKGLFAHYKFNDLTDSAGSHNLTASGEGHLIAGSAETIAQRMATNRTSVADEYLIAPLPGGQFINIFIDEA